MGLYLWLGLPASLRALGLHPNYSGPTYTLPGKRALIVTTSHATLGNTGKTTGVFGSEMTAPYYEFLDAGLQVDVASIQGGIIPIEPDSFRWFLAADSDVRYLKDPQFQAKDVNGEPLVKGKHMTAVTDRQVEQLGITLTPQHPERELRAAGALFESSTAFKDFFANHTTVDGKLVTGQNQNAGYETAQKMILAAGGKPRTP
jgi:putative intracellular protease/amidase